MLPKIMLGVAATIFILSMIKFKTTPQYFAVSIFDKDNGGTPRPASLNKNAADTTENLNILQHQIFKKFGDTAKISINSAYRSPAYNAKIGGVPNSEHTKANAIDFKVTGVAANEVQKLCAELMRAGTIKKGGIGLANSYTHLDTRGTMKGWTYASGNSGTTTRVNI